MVGEWKFFLFIEIGFLRDDDEIFPAFGVHADELDGIFNGSHRGEREETEGMD